jgi:hypothetical protein
MVRTEGDTPSDTGALGKGFVYQWFAAQSATRRYVYRYTSGPHQDSNRDTRDRRIILPISGLHRPSTIGRDADRDILEPNIATRSGAKKALQLRACGAKLTTSNRRLPSRPGAANARMPAGADLCGGRR